MTTQENSFLDGKEHVSTLSLSTVLGVNNHLLNLSHGRSGMDSKGEILVDDTYEATNLCLI